MDKCIITTSNCYGVDVYDLDITPDPDDVATAPGDMVEAYVALHEDRDQAGPGGWGE